MSGITFAYDMNNNIEKPSTVLKDCMDTYLFLSINNIYKLSKLAYKYSIYNAKYIMSKPLFDKSSLADGIANNVADDFISNAPEDIKHIVNELIELFRNIEIPVIEKYSFKKMIIFSLSSKKLTSDSALKLFIPFTNIRFLAKFGEKSINELLKDIHKIVYNTHISVLISYPGL